MHIEQFHHDGYEQVVGFTDDDFHCYIAIHSTTLGPALGGCRIKPYPTQADALLDVLRLAKAMSYKSSIAGLDFGGGKCVVVADRATPEIMQRVGEAVNFFDGRYITAEDVGTTIADTAIAAQVTPYVAQGDGSAMTARGVAAVMRSALRFLDRSEQQEPIWVQGLGKVGMPLVREFLRGLQVHVSDLRPELVAQAEAAGARSLSEPARRLMTIYMPCALGPVVHPGNLHSLGYAVICGAANNQLADESYATVLQKRGVLWVPDYLANAGGVISAAYEAQEPYDVIACEAATDRLGERLWDVLQMAASEHETPFAAANRLAEARFRRTAVN
jgi:glutamate dehydrogenase/leucine dehydrogenase